MMAAAAAIKGHFTDVRTWEFKPAEFKKAEVMA
jgi:hypothetical protein